MSEAVRFETSWRKPNLQRLFAFLLVVVQASTLGYMSDTLLFPALVSAAALYGALSQHRFVLSRQFRFRLLVSLALLFLLKYAVAPHEFRQMALAIRTPLMYTIGQFVMTVQVLELFAHHPPNRLPLRLPVLGVLVMVCFGDRQVTTAERSVFQGCSIAYAVLAAAYYGRRRDFVEQPDAAGRGWGRSVSAALVLAVAAAGAWVTAESLYRYERRIDEFLAKFMYPRSAANAVGFSGNARLGSLMLRKQGSEDRIALRVSSDQPPGYLRAKSFDRFANSQWYIVTASRPVNTVATPPTGIPSPNPGDRLVATPGTHGAAQWKRQECWPHPSLAGRFFTPLGTTHLTTSEEDVVADTMGIFRSEGGKPGYPYVAFVPETPERSVLSAERRNVLTELSPDLGARVRELAQRVIGNSRTVPEKIAAVESYFHGNYQYHLGITVPPGADPLTHFLVERPPAHCEYFASGAAVLLRLADVPCRYVTGFVTTERNRFGNEWVARNRDAHAWVEAYDESAGWITVEATPASGLPSAAPSSAAWQFWEYLRDRLRRLCIRIQQGGIQWLLTALVALLARLPGRLLLCGAALLAALFVLRKWWGRRPTRLNPLLTQLHRLLARMDARLRKLGLRRRDNETLHQFADRVHADANVPGARHHAAHWYRRYAAVRYGGPLDADTIEQLAAALDADVALHPPQHDLASVLGKE